MAARPRTKAPVAFDVASELLAEHSKRQILKIVRWVGADAERFASLMEVFLGSDRLLTQRASWAVSSCAEQNPSLALPWLKKIVRKMRSPDEHDAVRRNMLHVLENTGTPRALQGEVAQFCFELLASVDAPVAAKAFSMTVLADISETEPDLKNELRLVIEQMMPYGAPAIQSRGRKVLKQIQKGGMKL